jgi:RimJ/RimL family protein N-acetyltransferase/methionyl-tRNA formyltransferase
MLEPLESPRLLYRTLQSSDITDDYLAFLNNKDITQYLEIRNQSHTAETVGQFILSVNSSTDTYLYGIFLRSSPNVHIGNIKIGPIDPVHQKADIGIVIGNATYWGKGYATECISFFTYYCFSKLGLNCLMAGCYEENVGSYRAFKKSMWSDLAFLSNQRRNISGQFTGEFLIRANKSDYAIFPDSKGCTLIGSGEYLSYTASRLIERGIPVLAVFAPRHYDNLQQQDLHDIGCEIINTDDIHSQVWRDKLFEFNRFALCFGPAWIFSNDIIDIYQGLMYNLNLIPIPQYLGGAHYTWQVMNKDFQGGAFIQQITKDVDRGRMLVSREYQIEPTSTEPQHYLDSIANVAYPLIDEFLSAAVVFPRYLGPYTDIDWSNSLYLPRLNTKINAWIDWSWTAEDIHSFCNSFGAPYCGAQTYLCENIITVTSLGYDNSITYHPYVSGIILRVNNDNSLLVSTRVGLITVAIKSDAPLPNRLVGRRLHTPYDVLEKSYMDITYSPLGLISP